MALRFSRRVTIAPGIRLNLSKSGASLSVGPRGASMTFGRRGTYANMGLPGTGLSYRRRIDGASGARAPGGRSPGGQACGGRGAQAPPLEALALAIGPDGAVAIGDTAGRALPDDLRAAAVRAHRAALEPLMREAVDDLNAARIAALDVHRDTPAPAARIDYPPEPFDLPKPEAPAEPEPGLLDRLFGRTDDLAAAHRAALQTWRNELAAWRAAQANHDRREAEQRRRFGALVAGAGPLSPEQADAALGFLAERFAAIAWPHETHAMIGLDDTGDAVFLQIDLPEIEDMPDTEVALDRRSLTTRHKALSATAVRRLWHRHVHAVAFRCLGEAFAALPRAVRVVVNAETRRRDGATGRARDETVLSVTAARPAWSAIAFHDLEHVDPAEALDRLGCRRKGRGLSLEPVAPLPFD